MRGRFNSLYDGGSIMSFEHMTENERALFSLSINADLLNCFDRSLFNRWSDENDSQQVSESQVHNYSIDE